MKSFPWNRHDPYLVQMPSSKLSYFSENLQVESFLIDLESVRCFVASIIWILSLLVYKSVFLFISVLKTPWISPCSPSGCCPCYPSGCCTFSFFLANVLENVLEDNIKLSMWPRCVFPLGSLIVNVVCMLGMLLYWDVENDIMLRKQIWNNNIREGLVMGRKVSIT